MKRLYRSEAGAQRVEARYREILDRWPVPNRQFHVRTRQGETFVIASGDLKRPPLLLLHGGDTNSAIWFGSVRAYSERFATYAVDLIGQPGLSGEARPPYGSADHALWLGDVLQALALEDVSIMGASLGGWIALDYATRYPARVKKLALMCPAGVGRQRVGFLFKVLPLLLLGEWGRRRALAVVMGRGFKLMPRDGSDERDVHAVMSLFALVQKHFRSRMDPLPLFGDDALQKLCMPVLTLVGSEDVLLDSSETRQRLERNVRHAQVRYLEGAGHGLPDQTAEILRFLCEREQEVPAQRGG